VRGDTRGGTTKNPKPLNNCQVLSWELDLSRVVFVVDDEPLVCEVTASMLEDLGCEVITEGSGNDAFLANDRFYGPFLEVSADLESSTRSSILAVC
jgi:hypothetical protein